jgi:ribosome biogenesis GTPase
LTSRLEALGANERLAREIAELRGAHPARDLTLGRVARAMRKHCDVCLEDRDIRVRVPKRVFRAAIGAPVVGDWVAVQTKPTADADGRVVAVLPRSSTLARRAAGRAMAEQVVVANVDTAFVMVGLDGDFNLRRIERYLAVAWQGGVAPVVLLNKADLHPAPDAARDEVVAVASGAPVHVLCAKHGDGLDALAPYLEPAVTIVILGSSGAGKSTLVNQLSGEERMRTAEVRARDDRGRHTTSHRELIILDSGALLIDTPGMRELGLVDHGEGIAEAFADVEALVALCRFGDCQHDTEPGCAVRAAVEAGELDPARLASYVKLNTEVDAATARRNKEELWSKKRAYAKWRRRNK